MDKKAQGHVAMINKSRKTTGACAATHTLTPRQADSIVWKSLATDA